MKKIIFILVAFCIATSACSQAQIKREGNTFSVERTTSQQSLDTVKTVFAYKDSKDNIYPIWLNKKTGSCFIIRISGKTGKPYRQYMSDEIRQNVCTYYNIEYKPRNK